MPDLNPGIAELGDNRLPARFWSKIALDEASPSCWRWTAALTPNGYGVFWIAKATWGRAHRVAYEALVGPISDGLVIDHLCRVRDCVNPAHLEAVTPRENQLRGQQPILRRKQAQEQSHCKRGHLFSPENTRWNRDGSRTCRPCSNARRRQRRAEFRNGFLAGRRDTVEELVAALDQQGHPEAAELARSYLKEPSDAA